MKFCLIKKYIEISAVSKSILIFCLVNKSILKFLRYRKVYWNFWGIEKYIEIVSGRSKSIVKAVLSNVYWKFPNAMYIEILSNKSKSISKILSFESILNFCLQWLPDLFRTLENQLWHFFKKITIFCPLAALECPNRALSAVNRFPVKF